MERMMRIARGTGKVILALLGVALMPILIWVALGVVVYQKMRQRQVQRKPVPRHRWQVEHYPSKKREA